MSSQTTDPLTIVRNGEPQATIVLSQEPGLVVQLAARDLQHYIGEISGAVLPIVRESVHVEGTAILVGASKATEALGLTNGDFNQREYLLETRHGTLILMGLDSSTGGDLDYEGDLSEIVPFRFAPMGSCYAVHTFLEEFLDVRWFLPTEIGDVVPQRRTIELSDLKIRRMTAAADYDQNQYAVNRQLYVHDYSKKDPDGLTLTSLDYDTHFDRRSGVLYFIRNKRWGCELFAANHSFHGWDLAFGEPHPEWFSTKSWEKMRELIAEFEGFQLKINPVLSHEGVVKKKVEVIRAYFDGKPEPFPEAYYSASGNRFGICLNDNGNWSRDPECVKQYEPEMGDKGYVSRYFWTFVNRVAKEVRKTHPNGEIVGLAYWAYTLPPREPFRLEPNVSVMLCKFPIIYWNRDYRQNDYDQIDTWIRYGAKRIYTWEYLIWPSIAKSFPAVLPRTYAADAKWLLDHPQFGGGYLQMYGFGMDSNDGERHGGSVWENPQAYFFNSYFRWKLYDDPSRDIDAMLGEFYRLFYGPAAKPAQTFVEALEDRWNDRAMRERSGFGRAEADLPEELYWEHMGNADFVDELERLMAEVRAAAPAGSIYAARVTLLDQALLGHARHKRSLYLEALDR